MVICGCVPLEPVQEIARSLVEQLKADEYCPYELRVSQCTCTQLINVTIQGLIQYTWFFIKRMVGRGGDGSNSHL